MRATKSGRPSEFSAADRALALLLSGGNFGTFGMLTSKELSHPRRSATLGLSRSATMRPSGLPLANDVRSVVVGYGLAELHKGIRPHDRGTSESLLRATEHSRVRHLLDPDPDGYSGWEPPGGHIRRMAAFHPSPPESRGRRRPVSASLRPFGRAASDSRKPGRSWSLWQIAGSGGERTFG